MLLSVLEQYLTHIQYYNNFAQMKRQNVIVKRVVFARLVFVRLTDKLHMIISKCESIRAC